VADEDDESKDSKKKKKSKDEDEGKKNPRPPAPSLGAKIARAFLFTFLATFITAILFADSIPNGLRVDFDLMASIKLGLIAAIVAAVLRTVAGMLPLFADDHAKKKAKKDDDDD
jgi:hypothetical protein